MSHFTLFSLLASSALAADLYVSPEGTDSGTGSLDSPYASIQTAVDNAAAGDTIYLRGGTYTPTSNIQFTEKNGTADAPFTVTAYEGEEVTIDGEELEGTPAELGGSLANSDRGIFHIQGVEYWKFYNMTFINGPYGVYARDASNNYYERLTTHDNYETGFQLEGASSNNQVIYLDSYMNRDPRKNGESADGFACKEGQGEGNVLRGARLWNNVDDGLDLWEFKSPVTVEDVISYGNGFNRWDFTDFEGDGNGFKLGGGSDDEKGPAAHKVTNCISFGNAAKGFTDNKQPGDFVFTRNTAWNNNAVGFQTVSSTSSMTDNIAAANAGSTDNADQVSLESTETQGNSWEGSETWSNSSFVSVDASLVQGARQADGRIQASDFLLPKSGDAIGATTHWE
ncbi:polysaccharide lyase family 9 protein [Aplosporella prunicola CBS 121167]|uniref:Polysaccharide lyase family 9 protein n=1 Tax=Aplosporella prunicola CBS 121167 TaxID=1176127 RepID=A0A6A6AW75_9PEZI|nr:polysaccharide lyase family 9 protein [Aplosporella prunicola CBS 121167]KAF2136189.1 polysaccharide lyase family 9 protein [Aplosporella prunicola CBS 121167]